MAVGLRHDGSRPSGWRICQFPLQGSSVLMVSAWKRTLEKTVPVRTS